MRWLTILIAFVLTVAYLCIGAAVFQALESQTEQDTKTSSIKTQERFLERFKCVNEEDLEVLIQHIIHAYKRGVFVTNNTAKNSELDNWSYYSAFFFSATVVTTIGYGHLSPATDGGQLFCIFYAIFGIPLVGVFLAGIGQKSHRPFNMLREKLLRPSSNKILKALKSVFFALFGLSIIIFLPAYAFHEIEGWTMLEAIYYAVITLTTVGFGDYVVGQQHVKYRAVYKILAVVWIFLGLAFVSVLLTDMGEFLVENIRSATNVEEPEDETKNTDNSKQRRNEADTTENGPKNIQSARL